MPLTFEWDFPSGKCDPVTTIITNPESATPTVFVGMRYGTYRHWAIKLNGALNTRPIFEFDDTEYSGGDVQSPWRAWYTYDDPGDANAVWTWWDTDWTQDALSSINTGQLSTAFTSSTVYVAFQPLHTVARGLSYIQKLVADHPTLVHKPPCIPSANESDWAASYTSSFVDPEGRTIPALPIRAFRVTDLTKSPADSFPKRRIVLTNGIHSGEHSGGFVMEGLINYLLSGTPIAQELLRNFDFYCYPNVNPKGRYEGERRQNSDSGTDLNRDWGDDSLAVGAEATILLKSALNLDIPGGEVRANFDFHTSQGGSYQMFWYADTNALAAHRDAFYTAMLVYDAGYPAASLITTDTLNNYLFRKYGSGHAYIPEVTVGAAFPGGLGDLYGHGQSLAQSLSDLYTDYPDHFTVSTDTGTFAVMGTVLPYTLEGLVSGVDYEYRVAAKDASSQSAWSNWHPFKTAGTTLGLSGKTVSNASSSDSWVMICESSANLNETAVASDSLSGIAQINTSILAAAQAMDSAGDQPAAAVMLSQSATGNDTLDALANAAAALSAGASAGEAWSAHAQVLADMLFEGVGSEMITRQTEKALTAALQSASEASDQFLSAVDSIAAISSSANSNDAFVAIVTQLAGISSGAISSDTFSIDFGFPGAIQSGSISADAWLILASLSAELTEIVSAEDLIRARSAVSVGIISGAIASDSFAIVNSGIRYLVMGAITLRSALNYAVNIKP